MICTSFISRRLAVAALAAVLLPVPLPVAAHEGHDHAAEAKPADIRLAPRFEARGDTLEVVGVLAGKDLVVYLDRADDNAPIDGAEIEIEAPEFKGVAVPVGDGVYQVPAEALAAPGSHSLTITVQAGELADLLTAGLEVGTPATPAAAERNAASLWWLAAGIPLLLLGGVLASRRRSHRASEARN